MKPIECIRYGDISFRRGSFYRVTAPSGVGKSSMCNFLYGIRRDRHRDILFDDKEATSLKDVDWSKIRRCHIAYLTQDLRLFGELTVMENIAIKNRLTDHFSKDEIMSRLERLGVAEKAHWRTDRLSIGQQQRVALVRALCQPFDFLLLDEPVSHLDITNNAIAARMVAEDALRTEAGVITTSVGNPLLLEDCGVTVLELNL